MSEGKRLLCLYPWMEIGGADKFNLDMLGCLRARGWTSTVVTTLPSRHPWRPQFEKVAAACHDLALLPPEGRPGRLLEIIREESPDVLLISHSEAGYRLLPYLRVHCPNLPIVDYCHMEELNWGDGGFPRLSAINSRQLDLQLVSSQHLRQWIAERGGELERLRVCPTNIDPTDWNPAKYDVAQLRAARKIPSNAVVALYAGRLVRQKQPVLAIDIMRRVVAECPEVVFLIAGDGLFSGYLQAYVRNHRLEDRIRLLGPVSNLQIRELLAMSNLFFLPSEMEGISLGIFEAMAMGVVPISADVGGQAELVTSDSGVLISRGSGEGARYVDALTELVRHRERLRAMGSAARKRIENHFRLDQMGALLEAELEQSRELHRSNPRPAMEAPVAAEAARRMIEAAGQFETRPRDASTADSTWRRRLRNLYWRGIARGGWRLVPFFEQCLKWIQR